MGKLLSSLDDDITRFIQSQHVFFVASAPLSSTGHINASPKGLDSLRILSPKTVAYLDLTGSGIETIAHVKENGRIVLMFCAFEGPPRIVRLHGRARVIELGHPEFTALQSHFPDYPGFRSVIAIEITRVSQSCGFGVPLMHYESERTQLQRWAESKGPEGLHSYREGKNKTSIDGLPGFGPKTAASSVRICDPSES